MRKNLQTSRPWKQFQPRIVAIVGLVAFALMQVSIASHQFEHLAGDVSDACLACAQHDRLDDAAILDIAESRITKSHLLARIESFEQLDLQPVIQFSARAPPLT